MNVGVERCVPSQYFAKPSLSSIVVTSVAQTSGNLLADMLAAGELGKFKKVIK